MSRPLEDYALIGDLETAALVACDGSIDWFCVPRFDDPACLAALLGDERHGRWRIGPTAEVRAVRRRYRPGTLVLETEWDTDEGTVRVVDGMPPRHGIADIARLVQGVRGRVELRFELRMRFDYGNVLPWIRWVDGRLAATAGPDGLVLASDVELEDRDDHLACATFTVEEGQEAGFVLSWHRSHEPCPEQSSAAEHLDRTTAWWEEWSGRCRYEGGWRDEVLRSLVVVKAMTFDPTGGIVAAPTTSLPERPGGVRNWDYRFCWVRDATLSLQALMVGGYVEEAKAWRDWLLRALAGEPRKMQIMYGPAGERQLPERELPWLPGYEGSTPVRAGNAASEQFQLDVYGELMDAMHEARSAGMEPDPSAWKVQRDLLDFLEGGAWKEPDAGIWEMRGPTRHFTHSKLMAWVALDRAVRAVERSGLEGPVDRWRACREEIRETILRDGYDADRGAFTQSFDSTDLDASLLMVPLVGFLPGDDERVVSTMETIRRELCEDGFVLRYRGREDVDGLPPGEGAFLACTCWLADNLLLAGRREEAVETFERVLGVANDVGLLAEEYDPREGRLLGNFPQAFSHVATITTARNLSRDGGGPAEERGT